MRKIAILTLFALLITVFLTNHYDSLPSNDELPGIGINVIEVQDKLVAQGFMCKKDRPFIAPETFVTKREIINEIARKGDGAVICHVSRKKWYNIGEQNLVVLYTYEEENKVLNRFINQWKY